MLLPVPDTHAYRHGLGWIYTYRPCLRMCPRLVTRRSWSASYRVRAGKRPITPRQCVNPIAIIELVPAEAPSGVAKKLLTMAVKVYKKLITSHMSIARHTFLSLTARMPGLRLGYFRFAPGRIMGK